MRTPELALGILLAAGCGLGAVLWTASASSTTPALVLAHDVERGDVLGLEDFAPAEARATGLRLVAYAERTDYVGRIAAIDLPAATAITDSVALEIAPIADGEALVGLRIKAGQFPSGLRSGSTVRIVDVVDAAAAELLATTQVVIENIEPLESSLDEVVVTVRVPTDLSSTLVRMADIRLIEVPA